MPVRSTSSLSLLLLSSALILAGCGQQPQQWPGTGPTNEATGEPMAAAPVERVEMVPTQDYDSALNDRVARLERNVGGLESDVAGLQTDMTEAKPRLEKIDSMEKHFRQLSLELDRINKTYGVAPVSAAPAPAKKVAKPVPLAKAKPTVQAKPLPPVAMSSKPTAKPVPKSEAKSAAAVKPSATAAPLKVQKVRVGEQADGKTRIVLDTTSPAKINYDIDNGEKILVLEVPDAAWGAQAAQTLKNSALISSFKAESDAAGSRLIVQLKDEAKVVSTSRLDPSEGAGYRVFLDLAKK